MSELTAAEVVGLAVVTTGLFALTYIAGILTGIEYAYRRRVSLWGALARLKRVVMLR